MNKKELSESDICAKFITPAILQAGWDEMKQIRREVTLTPGPIVVRGNVSSRNKKKKKFADYVLYWEQGVPVGVFEAKDNNHTVSQGLQQALGYAEILEVPSAFSSNGDAFAAHNKTPVAGGDIRPFNTELNKYIFRYLISPFGRNQLLRFDNGSAQPNLSAGNVMLYALPLPPLAEQHCIVAKVDELMTLCDALKTRLASAQTTQIILADAIVEQAVA